MAEEPTNFNTLSRMFLQRIGTLCKLLEAYQHRQAVLETLVELLDCRITELRLENALLREDLSALDTKSVQHGKEFFMYKKHILAIRACLERYQAPVHSPAIDTGSQRALLASFVAKARVMGEVVQRQGRKPSEELRNDVSSICCHNSLRP
jgi:hypothetical protein